MNSYRSVKFLAISAVFVAATIPLGAQENSKVIIDQDCAGPGGTDMQAVLAMRPGCRSNEYRNRLQSHCPRI
jgi:hypothetical protein